MKEEVKSESDILNMDGAENFFFKPKSKKEALKILDIAEMQFANGEFTDSKVMEKDLAEEFKLKLKT